MTYGQDNFRNMAIRMDFALLRSKLVQLRNDIDKLEEKVCVPPPPLEHPAKSGKYDGVDCVMLVGPHYRTEEQIASAIKYLKEHFGDFRLAKTVPHGILKDDETALMTLSQYHAMTHGDSARMEYHTQAFENGIIKKRNEFAAKQK